MTCWCSGCIGQIQGPISRASWPLHLCRVLGRHDAKGIGFERLVLRASLEELWNLAVCGRLARDAEHLGVLVLRGRAAGHLHRGTERHAALCDHQHRNVGRGGELEAVDEALLWQQALDDAVPLLHRRFEVVGGNLLEEEALSRAVDV
eukprot:3790302-Prymnesium_polylepis.1